MEKESKPLEEEAPNRIVSDYLIPFALLFRGIKWVLRLPGRAFRYFVFEKGREHIAFFIWYSLLFPLTFPAIIGMFYRISREVVTKSETRERMDLRSLYTLLGLTFTSVLIGVFIPIANGGGFTLAILFWGVGMTTMRFGTGSWDQTGRR